MPKLPDPAQPLGPIPGLRPAGPLDVKEHLPLVVSMDAKWSAHLNERVVALIAAGTTGRLSHVQQTPDLEQGYLYITPCNKDAYGAQKVDYNGPERTARLSLYLGLLRFHLETPEGRIRDFEVVEREVKPGFKAVALNVKASTTRPGRPTARAEAAAGDQE